MKLLVYIEEKYFTLKSHNMTLWYLGGIMKRLCACCGELKENDAEIEGVRGAVRSISGRWSCATCRHDRLKFRRGGS